MAKAKLALKDYYQEHQLERQARHSPFLLRFTQWAGYSGPVLVVKERIEPEARGEEVTIKRAKTVERGHLYGPALRQCLPVLKRMVDGVTDNSGIPLELTRFFTQEGLKLEQLNLPLDNEAGAKAALFFKLQTNVKDADRIELLGRRIDRFSREEAAYWLAKITTPDNDMRRFAIRGLRIFLCGDGSKDAGINRLLTKLRAK
ncbi:hypothetical protein CGX12_00720 [Zobellella denitrificans]|uniref:DUF7680 family protein n=1 Tax=Zobellella denitrificans TaxID=347534 RepID=UPI000B8C3A73|nr:hypothetical protein [Zobellella denitrificans]OXS16973.1 hypothetical protein CGX12_00720 [Zobellella denitrificans]